MLTGPWSSLDFDGSGCERKRHSEPPGPSDFLRDQSCEVKGDGAISNGDRDGDGGSKALLSLYSVAHCGFPSRTSDQGVVHKSWQRSCHPRMKSTVLACNCPSHTALA